MARTTLAIGNADLLQLEWQIGPTLELLRIRDAYVKCRRAIFDAKWRKLEPDCHGLRQSSSANKDFRIPGAKQCCAYTAAVRAMAWNELMTSSGPLTAKKLS
jgi:hypothetical protein